MDVETLRFFEDRVVRPVTRVEKKLDTLTARFDEHEAQARREEEERAKKIRSLKRAIITMASIGAPIMLTTVAKFFGFTF